MPARLHSGKFISASSLIALISFPTGTVLAEHSALTAPLEKHLNRQLASYAKQQGWQLTRTTFSHQFSTPVPPPCQAPLRIQSDGSEPLARQRLTLACANPTWQVTVVSQPSLWVGAVHSARAIERGSVLSLDDLSLGELEVSRAMRAFYPSPDALVGLAVKRRLRAQQLISPNLVQNATVIARGELIKISANQQGISASTDGEALAAGRVGELIRVRNLKSGKILDAKVLGPGAVSSLY